MRQRSPPPGRFLTEHLVYQLQNSPSTRRKQRLTRGEWRIGVLAEKTEKGKTPFYNCERIRGLSGTKSARVSYRQCADPFRLIQQSRDCPEMGEKLYLHPGIPGSAAGPPPNWRRRTPAPPAPRRGSAPGQSRATARHQQQPRGVHRGMWAGTLGLGTNLGRCHHFAGEGRVRGEDRYKKDEEEVRCASAAGGRLE